MVIMEGEATSSKAISGNCGLCTTEKAKYCCPRCNVLYCSLDCYTSQNHLTCSEDFYKQCVKENLDSSDEKSKAKMLDILKRSHEENTKDPEKEELDSDDDDCDDLGNRLAGIDLDDTEMVWSKLTESERQEFEAFIKSGDISKFVQKWEPWWRFHCPNKIIDLNELGEYKANCPKVIDKIKDIFSLSSNYPSEMVKYNVINTLTAYVFMARYFNGEYQDFAREACSCMSNLSLCLKMNHNFEDFATAVESVHCQIISNNSWIHADQENIEGMREDIHKVLKGPHRSEVKYYIFAALSDIHKLIDIAISDCAMKKDKTFALRFPDSSFPTVLLDTKHKLKVHQKKIEYFLSYVKDCWQHV